MERQIQNIHFTNCQLNHNGSNGLVVGPDFQVDDNGAITQTFNFDNISLTNCSFNNPGVNVWLSTFTTTDLQPKPGNVTNFRMIGCSFHQEPIPGKSSNVPSCTIETGGSGCIMGCDFVSHDDAGDFFQSQIKFSNPPSDSTWRVIGNHFKASKNNQHPVIYIEGAVKKGSFPRTVESKAHITIIGNHYEAAQSPDNPEFVTAPHFVVIKNGNASAHIIHSNIGVGQIYLENDIPTPVSAIEIAPRQYFWLDVSPGIPMTLGSPSTKGRDVLADGIKPDPTVEMYTQDIELGVGLKPLIPGSIGLIHRVDYQVEVTFQWDAGNWWISKKDNDKFTLNWTKKAPADAKFDWTLHL